MRERKTTDGLTVQTIAGAHVVMLGMDMKQADCEGLMGFAIHRTDHTGETARFMEGIKTFEATDPGFLPGSKYPTNEHPIQGFTWSDFSAKPGRRYTYRVQALTGTPQALVPSREVSVEARTESEADGTHDVFFNRGAAASQEFARRFGNVRPDPDNPNDPRWKWLSRGAMESIEAFVGRATDAHWSVRVCAYEFRLRRFADALRAAHLRGADVKILFDACNNPPDEHGVVFPRDLNRAMAEEAHVKGLCKDRITRSDVNDPPIPHNKFVVLLKDGQPDSVLTGSANFSLGGVFGQSNVIHIVEDPAVAAAYARCWDKLAANTDFQALRSSFSSSNPLPPPQERPPVGTSCIFSPQQTLAALDWYAARAKEAQKALFMTFAFGINKVFMDVYRNGTAGLRYALLDKLLRPGIKASQLAAAEQEMRELREMVENRFAVGNLLPTNKFDRWLKEALTGLNQHVRFIHTKFMLIDPLGDDPIVITGSANFSDASTKENDENMMIIRGDRRVADIYVGEYMRLWNHYAFREWAEKQQSPSETKFKFLDVENQWWRAYFGGSAKSRQRAYFSGAQ
jgi:phosphatidylserine/phosphatidylglycerophosphate/cardiolipin synthase-like enzyme